MTEFEAATIVKLAWADFPNYEITPETAMKFHYVLKDVSYLDAREAVARLGRVSRDFPVPANAIYEEVRIGKLQRAQNAKLPAIPEPKLSESKKSAYLKLLEDFRNGIPSVGTRFRTADEKRAIQRAAMETIEKMHLLRKQA